MYAGRNLSSEEIKRTKLKLSAAFLFFYCKYYKKTGYCCHYLARMNLETYSEGSHILLTLKVSDVNLLLDYDSFIRKVKEILVANDTEVVGETHHIFSNGSFTSAVILKESHLCIHTWPEFSQLTFDILLCNYFGDNSQKTENIANAVTEYFAGQIINEHKIKR